MYRRILTVIFAALVCVSTTTGQYESFSIGIEAGPSIISLKLDGDSEFTDFYYHAAGFVVGVSLQYQLSEKFTLQSGLAYERKGGLLKLAVTDEGGMFLGIGRTHFNYNYLKVPF